MTPTRTSLRPRTARRHGRRSLPCAPMDLRTNRREVAGHVVLAIDGTADLAALPILHDALQRVVGRATEGASIVVDLDGVVLLDDAALGLLLGAAATARARSCDFRVVCSDERLRRRLTDTRFDRVVDVDASLGGTVADLPPDLS